MMIQGADADQQRLAGLERTEGVHQLHRTALADAEDPLQHGAVDHRDAELNQCLPDLRNSD